MDKMRSKYYTIVPVLGGWTIEVYDNITEDFIGEVQVRNMKEVTRALLECSEEPNSPDQPWEEN